jgi:hypothetical protein
MPVTELYGLRIRSAMPLPGVLLPESTAADVTVHLDARPHDAPSFSDAPVRPIHSSESSAGAPPVLVVDRPSKDGLLRLRYAEGIRFHVSAAGDEVWCDWRAPLTEADVAIFLLGPVMGSVLRRRGVFCLHASAVAAGDGVWAFVGPGGSGKSTLAAALAQAGHAVVTEDLLALRPRGGEWIAAPAYKGIRLWEDAARLVRGDVELPALSPTWPKRHLDLARHSLPMAARSAPLRALVVLENYGAPGVPPLMERLSAQQLFVEVIANVYANYAATGEELARELPVARALAAVVRGWRLRPGEGTRGLIETVEVVDRFSTRPHS